MNQRYQVQDSVHKHLLQQHYKSAPLVLRLYSQTFVATLQISTISFRTLFTTPAATLQISTISFRTLFTNSCGNTTNQHHQFQDSIHKLLRQHYKSAPSVSGLYSWTLAAALQISTISFRTLFTNSCGSTTNQHHQFQDSIHKLLRQHCHSLELLGLDSQPPDAELLQILCSNRCVVAFLSCSTSTPLMLPTTTTLGGAS